MYDFQRSPIVTVLLAAVGMLLTACSQHENEHEPAVAVQVARAQRGEVHQQIDVEAVLSPKDQAALTAKISAPVRTFYVNRGSRVHKGELLAVLENRDLAAAEVENKGAWEQAQAAYNIETSSALPEEWQKAEYDLKSAKQAYEGEQKVYESRQNLYREGALPRKDLDQANVAMIQAKGQYEVAQKHIAALEAAGKRDQLRSANGQLTSAQGKYEGAAAQLSYSEIRSPIDGVITERPLYPGEMAAPGSPLLIVMDTSRVIAKAHIPQDEAAALQLGDAAMISAPGDLKASGKVTVISPALDPNSTTVEIWVEAANPNSEFRPGSTVRLQIAARTVRDAVLIPSAALLKTPDGETVVMVAGSDGVAHQVAVETGTHQDERVQIVKGLSGNESVIVRGGYGIPDKTKITVAAASPVTDGNLAVEDNAKSHDKGKD